MAKKLGAQTIFVNLDKQNRAMSIVALLNRAPKSEEESDVKTKFTALLKEREIDVKNTDEAVLAVYEILGGLVRTQAHEAKVKKVVKENKGKGKPAAKEDEDEADEDEESDEEEGDEDEADEK